MNKAFLPIVTISIFIVLIWYSFSIVLNSSWALDKAERNGQKLSFSELVHDTWSQKKPKLPTPHQVGYEMYKTIFDKKVTSKRSLVYHGWITLSATLAGFMLGTLLGILLALAMDYYEPNNTNLGVSSYDHCRIEFNWFYRATP
jgi:NitT/TauT family transport system permease protein